MRQSAGRSKDPGRELAKLALSTTAFEAEMLEAVIDYAFEQLCWRRNDAEIEALLERLKESTS